MPSGSTQRPSPRVRANGPSPQDDHWGVFVTTSLGVCLLYLASVGLFHAHPRRARIRSLNASALLRRFVFVGAWVLAGVALILIAEPQGWERGIPIWIGLFGLAGFVSIFLDAVAPMLQLRLAVLAALASLALAGAMLWSTIA